MKKTIIILSAFALIVSSCKHKTATPQAQADSLNIQQELPQEQEQEHRDTMRLFEKQKRQSEFYSRPSVSAEEIAMIAPVIKKWTDFYNIDFAQARLTSDVRSFDCPPYCREFTPKCDTDKRIDVDYSPDKQRYVDLGISDGTYYNEEDKKYYFTGWDDCQEIYLTDRKQKHQNMIIWLGVSSLAEAVFWKSNDIFMVVGYDLNYNDILLRFVYVFDIKKQTKNRYEITTEIDGDYDRYMNEVYLKEKEIFVSN